jgi:hypothetical protein
VNFTPRPTYPQIRTLVGRQLVWTLRGTEESLVPDGTRTLSSPVRSLSLYRLNNSRRLFPTCRWNALPRRAGPNPDRCLEDQDPGTGTPLPPGHIRRFPHFTHSGVAFRFYTKLDKFLVRLSDRALSVLHFSNFLQALPPVGKTMSSESFPIQTSAIIPPQLAGR